MRPHRAGIFLPTSSGRIARKPAGRGDLTPLQGKAHRREERLGSVHQDLVECNRRSLPGADVVDHALPAGQAILPQGQALGGQLHQMGLIGPLRPGLAPLVLHRLHAIPVSLQEIDPAAYPCPRGVQGDGSGMEGLEALRNGILPRIDPAVLQPALGEGGAVGELALGELQVA